MKSNQSTGVVIMAFFMTIFTAPTAKAAVSGCSDKFVKDTVVELTRQQLASKFSSVSERTTIQLKSVRTTEKTAYVTTCKADISVVLNPQALAAQILSLDGKLVYTVEETDDGDPYITLLSQQ